VPDNYEYIDPEYIYTNPETGVLRNLANISSRNMLTIVETGATTKRTKELEENPLKIKDSKTLLDIHRHLFQDIYQWAGVRTVEISKGRTPFFPVKRFNTAFLHIDTLIAEYRRIDMTNTPRLAHKLAEILDNINYLHPFREGNGRTQREFLRLLALERKLSLNLNPPDNADVYKRYMSGTIQGDVEKLYLLILEIITSKKNVQEIPSLQYIDNKDFEINM
jgi:cell filamentation protein